jgi:hypothetical protein
MKSIRFVLFFAPFLFAGCIDGRAPASFGIAPSGSANRTLGLFSGDKTQQGLVKQTSDQGLMAARSGKTAEQ